MPKFRSFENLSFKAEEKPVAYACLRWWAIEADFIKLIVFSLFFSGRGKGARRHWGSGKWNWRASSDSVHGIQPQQSVARISSILLDFPLPVPRLQCALPATLSVMCECSSAHPVYGNIVLLLDRLPFSLFAAEWRFQRTLL